jgi:uncharacterized repeat protein (TIGR04138 family)
MGTVIGFFACGLEILNPCIARMLCPRKRLGTMAEIDLEEKIIEIAEEDGRYHPEAYRFIFESLDYLLYRLGKHDRPVGNRHVSVQELLEGVKEYALEQFGPLSRIVLEEWGISSTADVGEIVFNLVEEGLLNKQESDSKEDFAGGFDFREVFEESYIPDIPW